MHTRLAVTILLYCATMIPVFAQTQAATLSPEDRELIDVALGPEWAAADGVIIESTAPICKPAAIFCIPADLLDEDVIRWDFPDSAEMRRAFLERNQQTLEIGTLRLKLMRIPRVEMERIFARGHLGWPVLRRMYPGVRSIIQVSAPAYGSDGLHALIYVHSGCGGRCGGGAVLLFERTSGRWTLSRNLINLQH